MRYLVSILLAVCALVCTPDVGYSSPDIDQGDLITVGDQVNETMAQVFSMENSNVFSERYSFFCADELIKESGEAPPLLLKHFERPGTSIIEVSKVRHGSNYGRYCRGLQGRYNPAIHSPPLIRYIV